MQAKSDAQLLRDYASSRDEAAFREIVARHTDLVYSAAWRQVESSDLAGDVAQSVFLDLARKAKSVSDRLSADASLAGWLYRSTRYTALNHLRDTRRRTTHERLAMEQLIAHSETAPDWGQIRPLLDEIMSALDDDDREALLLRYFKNQDFRAVGAALGISDDAAQKRVSRAVERLRELFAKRGVTVGAGGLVIVIAANAVQAAPAGLAAMISTAALTGTAVTATIATATKAIAMTTIQKVLVATTIAIVAGAGIYETHQSSQLRDRIQALQQQQAPMAAQIQQLQQERDNATKRLAALLAENERLNSASQADELLRLRSEVTRLRDAENRAAGTNDSQEALVKSWLEREARLKQLAAKNPDKSIPEFQLLSEKQWLDAAMDASFDTDKAVDQVLAHLRNAAENSFAAMTQQALQDYAKTNNGSFPSDLSQLQPYFSAPVSADILDRWEIVPQAAVPNVNMGGDWIITQKTPLVPDPNPDLRFAIGPGGYGSTSYESSDIADAATILQPVVKAYAAANNGQQPASPSQIAPYLSTPEQKAAFQKMLDKFPNNPSNGKPW